MKPKPRPHRTPLPLQLPFRATHVIAFPDGEEIAVMLTASGCAYRQGDWESGGAARFECVGDDWSDCGQPLDADVRRVGHRPLRPGETVARVPMSIRVPPEVKARIIAQAEARGVSPGDLVMELAADL